MAKIHVMAEYEQPRHETVAILFVPVGELEAMFPGGVSGYLERCGAGLIPEFDAYATLDRDDLVAAIQALTALGFQFNQHMILTEAELILPSRRTTYLQEKGTETPWAESWLSIHPVDRIWLKVTAEIRKQEEPEDVDNNPITDPGPRE